ncbi:MAG: hypothetical protein OSJ43_01950 [Oscillospiraceae bacterium]|nr:hypothetical protein [Oscillospiraceae bacterium]
MSKTKKIILTVLAVLFGLLVLANTFMIWILAETIRAEHSVINQRPSLYMNTLLNNDEETLASDSYKSLVADILKDDPGIIAREPVIFLANPGLKPVVAKILAEDSSIREHCLLTIKRNPDLIELEPSLGNAV